MILGVALGLAIGVGAYTFVYAQGSVGHSDRHNETTFDPDVIHTWLQPGVAENEIQLGKPFKRFPVRRARHDAALKRRRE